MGLLDEMAAEGYQPQQQITPTKSSELTWYQPEGQTKQTPIKQNGNILQRAALGFGSGIVSSGIGLGELATRGIKKIAELSPTYGSKTLENIKSTETGYLNKLINTQEKLRTGFESQALSAGTAGKVAYNAEKIAEFLVPSSGVSKIEKGMSLLPRMATEGLVVGGQTAIQQGKIDNNAKTAAIVGALFPAGATLLKTTKTPLSKLGEKIQTTVIRPTSKDLSDGFKIQNLQKYNIGGSLKDTAIKTQTTLNDLSQQLSDKLKNSNVSVNLNDVYKQTINDILGKAKSKQFGDIGATQRVLKSLQNEIKEVAGKNGLVDLVEATNVKRGAGTKGAWSFGRTDPDSSAVEAVYSNFYSKLKTAIEQVAPKEVASINKQLSELIPISNAVIRRLPVAERNNVLGLTDSIGLFASVFDPRALALLGAKTLSQSGKFGNFLVKVAEQKNPTTAVGKRLFGN